MRKLKRRLDESVKELDSRMQDGRQSKSTVGQGEINRLESLIEKRIQAIEEQLNDKASKQSVAQALHRKVNKPENDEILA
mgnify:CR=1 FL=1